MSINRSVDFFERQFRQQLSADDQALNPFESLVLPHAQGDMLDFGCGLGHLAVAAARRGCRVTALDGSAAAVDHLQALAPRERLTLRAMQADLRAYAVEQDYDTVVSIGLLMFFDCDTAQRVLSELAAHVRPGGVIAINVLIEGTTFLDMFDPAGHCLFARRALAERFEGWTLLHEGYDDHPAPRGTIKSFATVIARRPAA